ncbi:acyltransferase family protein [Terriglobus albidus]|uniref:acyltransferase family protein n=1 Tax=Terriglobus albidus TaxID=1592106 RepID=UPI0021DF4BBE|nr:acyltransferase [Terriglobus albidus]
MINTSSNGRLQQLDGIRGIAIILVFAVHTYFLSWGWIGVQIFFVLSGFLITGILRRARNDEAFWAPFYVKRATRILPPLLVAVAAAALFYHIPWHSIGIYDLFFLANVAETLHRGQSKGLSVLWSLAVEEHFYFIWPFAVRYLKRGRLIAILGTLIIFEPIIRAIATPLVHTFWPIFFLTPFQLDGLAVGALLALLLESDRISHILRRWCNLSLLLSIAIYIALSAFLPSFQRAANSILFNSLGYSIILWMATSLIAYVILRPTSQLTHILATRPLAFIGLISYGIYLYHPLIIDGLVWIGVRHGVKHLRLLMPLQAILVMIASWLSYTYYEASFIAWGRNAARAGKNHASRGLKGEDASEVEPLRTAKSS